MSMLTIVKRTECSKQAKGNDPIKPSGLNPDGRIINDNLKNNSNNLKK